MNIERILVATDLSDKSEVAYAHVAAFARAFPAAHVDLLHVDATADTYLGLLDEEVVADYRASLREVASAALARHGELLGGACGGRTSCHMVEGEPWREILRTAGELGATMIVLSQPSGPEPPLLGSTTKRVIRHGELPVLVVDPTGYRSTPTEVDYQRIFFATDFSVHADRGLLHAIELARRLAASLNVIHVEASPGAAWVPQSPAMAGAAAALAARLHVVMQRRLSEALQRTRAAGVQVEPLLLQGHDPAQRIVDAADEETDLIVIPSHGRGAAESILLGSVSERVLRRTQRPVLVLRRDWLERQGSEPAADSERRR